MRRRFALITLLLAVTTAVAEPPTSIEQLSAVDRGHDGFYGAIAADRLPEVTWAVTPDRIELGSHATLLLKVSGAANPLELTRPPLASLTEFQQLFSVIEDVGEAEPADGSVTFRYKVRPRNEGAFKLPDLRYFVYVPLVPTSQRFQPRYPPAVTFQVVKPAVKVSAAVPLEAPARILQLRTESGGGDPPEWAWAALFGGAALLGVGWVVGWRWLYPDAARLAKIRRTRAVRVALDRLSATHQSADPAGQVAGVFRHYLAARFGLPPTAQTPAEVADALRAQEFDPAKIAAAETLLRRCDTTRFGKSNDDAASLAATARQLIEGWELATTA